MGMNVMITIMENLHEFCVVTATIVFISNVRFNNYIRQIALLVVLFKTLSICNSPLLFFLLGTLLNLMQCAQFFLSGL